jgi:hypothetical protein
MGLKLSPGIMTWRWKDRELPTAVLEANRSGPPPLADSVVDKVNGTPIYTLPLLSSKTLQVEAPAGQHLYRFRYPPWDVPLGIVLFVAGCFLSMKLWFHPSLRQQQEGIAIPPEDLND